LDIKGPNLVKGIHLEGLRVLGKPERFARYYYENGADELFYMDTVASLYGRNSLSDIIEKTAREIFIPLTVGGGLRTIEDIRAVLKAKADKIAINTAAVARPELIREAAHRFGSSTIVVSIDAIRHPDGSYEAFTDFGRQKTGVNVFEWAVKAVELGAGEIMITSIDREGTGKGFDVELIKKIAATVPVPVIACGGAGDIAHVTDVVREAQVEAVALASMLHYYFLENSETSKDDFSSEGNVEFLKHRPSISKIHPASLLEIKKQLTAQGVECREVSAEVARG
jgi:cyclase